MSSSLKVEKWHPIVLGIVFGSAALVSAKFGICMPDSESFYAAVITLGGIFSAFSVTIKSLLISNRSKVNKLRDSNYLETYMFYVAEAVNGSLVLCAAGLIGFVEFFSDMTWYTPAIIGIFFHSLLALRRVNAVSTAILRQNSRNTAG